MADAGGIDVLMAVVNRGAPMMAEGATRFAEGGMSADKAADRMWQGFEPGRVFELQDFQFSVGVETPEEKRKAKEAEATKADGAKAGAKDGADDKNARRLAETKGRDQRQSREEASKTEGAGTKMIASASSAKDETDVDMQPVEYTRVFDTASTLLFQAMVECDTLKSISVIKRKAAGTDNSGEVYLRLDFEQVLITGLQWRDGVQVVIETGTFIYRKVTIRYRPQKPDGTLGAVVQTKWEKTPVKGT